MRELVGFRLRSMMHSQVSDATAGFRELRELGDFKFGPGLRELGCSRMGRRQLGG